MYQIFNIIRRVKLKIKYSFSFLLRKKNQSIEKKNIRVEEYYDKHTQSYLESYGKIIQSARPASDDDFVDHFIESIGITDGMYLLDAGCGVCGPAIEIAKRKKVNIQAITISEVQVDKAVEYISKENLCESIKVIKGDFSNLEKHYYSNTFDIVYFLETLGYSEDFKDVLRGAIKTLKPGGFIYIKDYFTVPILNELNKNEQRRNVELIKEQYLYNVHNLRDMVGVLNDLGLYIEFIKPLKIIEDFSKAASFEIDNDTHFVYTKVMHLPFQLFESIELKFRKVYQ